MAALFALLSACQPASGPIAYKAYSADPDSITNSLQPLGSRLIVASGQWLVLRLAQEYAVDEVHIAPIASTEPSAGGEFTLSVIVDGKMMPIYSSVIPQNPIKSEVTQGIIAKTLVVEFTGTIGNTVGFDSLTIIGRLP